MPRIGDPQPDLQKIRLGLGLTTEEAARRIGITASVLVHYEAKGYGYDPAHDALALDTYIVYAIGAYSSDEVFRAAFPIKEEDRPVAAGRPSSHLKGN
ncbi:helix-turn-helix domain-containing protein [Microbacterium dauci]|uniref:Helix-turn-helix transcriptional regulator n=1 Tax=Microbacterium dauci TaxID=3048008 RepID=A0ABT6ZGY2_9MICO|nr:helix-turn-helix transcriptional regulator [Microbacterium sp. LX3-4]MDJ1115399.1 helix-turn-helix transcriptional regulator [Microbacterium sp. LX3-4]